jgi:GNAT superfamily N-acetyltransferase
MTAAWMTTLRAASIADIAAIADLHARSWRKTYRGLFTDAFLDGPVFAEREALWTNRLSTWDPARNVVLLAEREGRLAGFASVMLDLEPEWGARLDNLHVDPAGKGRGTGRALMRSAASWVLAGDAGADATPRATMLHLMVFEANVPARGFYTALGGECVERREVTVEDGSHLAELRFLWRNPAALAATA